MPTPATTWSGLITLSVALIAALATCASATPGESCRDVLIQGRFRFVQGENKKKRVDRLSSSSYPLTPLTPPNHSPSQQQPQAAHSLAPMVMTRVRWRLEGSTCAPRGERLAGAE